MFEHTLKTTQANVPTAVQEEHELLRRIQDILRRAPVRRASVDYDKRLLELRDALNQERLPEDRASILEQMSRVADLKAQHARTEVSVADPQNPYFGHMRIDYTDGRRRDVMVGKKTYVTKEVTIVDWRHAPVSQIFYQYRTGDDFEMEIANRDVQGVVRARRTLTIDNGNLRRVATGEHTFILDGEHWTDAVAHGPALRGGAGVATRPDKLRRLGVQGGVPSIGGNQTERLDKHLPEIASLLDQDQFELITNPDHGVVAIQGSAGSGKTTVALHRVAYLAYADPKRFKAFKTQVIVCSRALSSYISRVLPALGVPGVGVATYQSWAQNMRRSHFRNVPHVYADDTPAIVVRFKLHSLLLPFLAEMVERFPKLGPFELFEEIFTDRKLLSHAVKRHAPGTFSPEQLETVHRWCTRAHFNRVDGGGAMEHEVPSIDREDDTILLYLSQLVRGPLRFRKKKPLRYCHLVVDEVQDLSPIELKVLLGTVGQRNPVTLAGDLAQKIVAESDFNDWHQVFDALGLDDIQLASLNVSYRSTAEIMELALAVVEPLRQHNSRVQTTRSGAPTELFEFRDIGETVTFLGDALHSLIDAEPHANVALLTRTSARAEEYYRALQRMDIPRLRRVRDQDFNFTPGVEVTDVRQTKGLEFDYVIMLDCDTWTYPANPDARHLMHVGITRAAHQCWLVSVGRPSTILPEWLVATKVV